MVRKGARAWITGILPRSASPAAIPTIVCSVMPVSINDMTHIFAATCLTAGVAFFTPIRRLFENRLSNFLGYISFPLYLVQATVIYSFSVRGLDLLASSGFEPPTQRWLVGAATIPVAVFFAVVFCPVNDIAVKMSRRLGGACTMLFDDLKQKLPLRAAS